MTEEIINPLEFARELDQSAIKWAYKTYWEKDFLRLAKIDSLDQIEKDRIFNELVVGAEVLMMMSVEAKDLHCSDVRKEMLLKVRDYIPTVHDAFMIELGIERKFRKIWKKPIYMRYDEYNESKHNAREAMMEHEGMEKELDIKGMEGITFTLLPFIVAVGMFKHIVRQKDKGRDTLYKLVTKKLFRYYFMERIVIEGVKLPISVKAKLKARHLSRDLKEYLNKEYK